MLQKKEEENQREDKGNRARGVSGSIPASQVLLEETAVCRVQHKHTCTHILTRDVGEQKAMGEFRGLIDQNGERHRKKQSKSKPKSNASLFLLFISKKGRRYLPNAACHLHKKKREIIVSLAEKVVNRLN